MKKSQLLLISLAALVLGVGVWTGWTVPFFGNSPAPKANGIVFDDPRPIVAFQLTDHKGRVFDAERLRNYWSLIYFGFTHCPDLCPMTLAKFAQLDEQNAPTWTNKVRPLERTKFAQSDEQSSPSQTNKLRPVRRTKFAH